MVTISRNERCSTEEVCVRVSTLLEREIPIVFIDFKSKYVRCAHAVHPTKEQKLETVPQAPETDAKDHGCCQTFLWQIGGVWGFDSINSLMRALSKFSPWKQEQYKMWFVHTHHTHARGEHRRASVRKTFKFLNFTLDPFL